MFLTTCENTLMYVLVLYQSLLSQGFIVAVSLCEPLPPCSCPSHSRPCPLLVALSSPFHYFRSNKHEMTPLQQHWTQGLVSQHQHQLHVVEVVAVGQHEMAREGRG